ncbi:MAG: type II toxin-antitoxin system VapC family toxin [Armatimonadota bacterium]
MRLLIVDASVAVKWYVPERNYERALALEAALRDRKVALSAPDLIIAEVGNAIARKVAAKEVTEQDAARMLHLLVESPVSRIDSARLGLHALSVAQRADISFYDALYVSAAEAADTKVVTADDELIRRLRRARLGRYVVSLSELAL